MVQEMQKTRTYVSNIPAYRCEEQADTHSSMDMDPEFSARMNESAKGESGIGPKQPAYAKEATVGGPGSDCVVLWLGDCVDV